MQSHLARQQRLQRKTVVVDTDLQGMGKAAHSTLFF